MDLRVLGWEMESGITLVHVDHHRPAYVWADRNDLAIQAAQIVAVSTQAPQPVVAAEVSPEVPAESPFTRSRAQAAGTPATCAQRNLSGTGETISAIRGSSLAFACRKSIEVLHTT